MTMRDEFEAWRVRNIKSQELAAAALAQGSEGVYDNAYTLAGWEAWQAAYSAGQRANPWEEVFKDALVNHWIEDEHWADPQKAIAALLQRAAQHALDPSISEAAQALIAQGQRAERERIATEIETLRNSHCHDTQGECDADGSNCDIVAAWNDAIAIARGQK